MKLYLRQGDNPNSKLSKTLKRNGITIEEYRAMKYKERIQFINREYDKDFREKEEVRKEKRIAKQKNKYPLYGEHCIHSRTKREYNALLLIILLLFFLIPGLIYYSMSKKRCKDCGMLI